MPKYGEKDKVFNAVTMFPLSMKKHDKSVIASHLTVARPPLCLTTQLLVALGLCASSSAFAPSRNLARSPVVSAGNRHSVRAAPLMAFSPRNAAKAAFSPLTRLKVPIQDPFKKE